MNTRLVILAAALFAPAMVLADHSEPAPTVIYCATGNGQTVQGGNNVFFKKEDCGGVLPSNNYIGAISGMQINGGTVGFRAFQPKEGPGAYFWANQAGGKFYLAVTYIRVSNL